jgi:hypothetical protein
LDQIEQIGHTLHNLRSPKRGHTFWGMMAVLLLSALWVWYEHSDWATRPNDIMLGPSPDCFKNYVVSEWHTIYDSTYTHYDGMNYPYGEHVLFTDDQPIINGVLQWWSAHISSMQGKVIGVLNLLQLASIVLGCGILFLLFRKLHLPVWYAGLASIGIVFLSPQYLRFDAHFALSHTWIIPLMLFLLCRYEERYSRRYQSLLIGILVWVAGQIHFYYFGLAAMFLGLYTVFQLLADHSLRNWRVRFSHLVVMVLLPLALLNAWVRWSDHVRDRPHFPFGFLVYTADWKAMFLPYKSFPLSKWIDAHLVKMDYSLNNETIGYFGTVATLFLVFILVRRFRIFPESWDEAAYHRVHKRYLWGILFASGVLAFFSTGFPFTIKGMEWLQEYMGPLRQFRSMARFTWAFYYVLNLVAFYVLWNSAFRFKGWKGRYLWLRWPMAALPMALLLYEAWQIQYINTDIIEPNITRREIAIDSPDHWVNKVNFKQFQALLPLPYYHVGSENIWKYQADDYWHERNVQITALHTGVPTMGVNMSRTSLLQTIKSVQLSTRPFEEPAILEDLPDNRPLALLIDPKREQAVQEQCQHLIRKARPVYRHEKMIVLSLSPDSLRAYRHELIAQLKTDYERQALYPADARWKADAPAGYVYSQSYDSLSSSRFTFQGNGALEMPFTRENMLYSNTLPKGRYSLRLWIKADLDMGMTLHPVVEQFSTGGQLLRSASPFFQDRLLGFVDGWALTELLFEVQENEEKVQVTIPRDYVTGKYYIDEMLVKSEDFHLWARLPGWIVLDNEWYKL